MSRLRRRHFELSPGLSVRGGPSLLSQVLGISGLAALYDPSDLTSIYQSRTGGSTGAVDSVVGIMLSKKEMGGKTAAAFIAGQSELVANGGFDADASWTKGAGWTIAGGVGVAAAASADLSQASILTVGNWYWIQYTVSGYSAGTLTPKAGSGASGTAASANGTYTAVLRAATTTSLIFTASGLTANIDNVSVRELPGYHALAPSDAARPILRAGRIEFDGSDDRLAIIGAGAVFRNKGAGFLASAHKWRSSPTTAEIGFGWNADTTSKVRIAIVGGNTSGKYSMLGRRLDADSLQTVTSAASLSTSTPEVVSAVVDWTNSNAYQYINGVLDGSSTAFSTDGSSQDADSNSAAIGGRADGNAADIDWYGGAVVSGSTPISDADRVLIQHYLASLAGVTL